MICKQKDVDYILNKNPGLQQFELVIVGGDLLRRFVHEKGSAYIKLTGYYWDATVIATDKLVKQKHFTAAIKGEIEPTEQYLQEITLNYPKGMIHDTIESFLWECQQTFGVSFVPPESVAKYMALQMSAPLSVGSQPIFLL